MSGREVVGEGGKGDRAARKRWWVLPVKLLLTVGVTWLILRGAGIRLGEVGTVDWALVRLDVPYLVLSVALLFVTFGIAAVLWSRNLVEFGERRVGVVEGASILLIANLGRYVPGKILALAGVAVLARRRGMSGVRATGAAVTAQMVNLLGAAVVGVWVAVWSAGLSEAWKIAVGVAIVAGLAGFLYFGGAGTLLRWVLRRSGHAGELPNTSGRNLLRLLPGYIVNWVVHGAAFVCLSRGIGLDIGFGVGTTAFAAAYFMGYVVMFAPGGIGIRESGLALFLTPILGMEAAALALAVLQRVWITAVELVGAVVGAVVLRRPAVPSPADAGTGIAEPATISSPQSETDAAELATEGPA
ncbi:MAG: lysylphosphatidylglycerol synthase transmembrane domain-containing protein [Gemmatimonadota bacterium]|nr:lysylphosphatidylglycerol synthase transmembrane domain-containing protein [Gemmatimonadota bacterium]MDE2983469.1 lysylphosphatidylglycerol synthase transmembrane domain-containing protein [Gemmatimonadota bacterium]